MFNISCWVRVFLTYYRRAKMLTYRLSDTGYLTEKGPCPAFKGEGKSYEILWPTFTDVVSRNWREVRSV
jgi:hypothetical protein